jgi:nicotinate-nucleotide adenylyltransferase
MKVGLFGGTFDPIHRGHLDVAQAARTSLGLDWVWVIPARVPPHRTLPQASAAHRFAMAALAIDSETGLRLSDVEMGTDGPSYTVATLDRLETRGLASHSTYFITGADAFRDIASWKAYPALLDRCHFVAVSPPGCPADSLRQVLPALAGRMHDVPCTIPASPSIFLVDAPTAPVSSTGVRTAIARRESIADMVAAPVARYIEREGLYRPQATA